jgi:hypothetical protein
MSADEAECVKSKGSPSENPKGLWIPPDQPSRLRRAPSQSVVIHGRLRGLAVLDRPTKQKPQAAGPKQNRGSAPPGEKPRLC